MKHFRLESKVKNIEMLSFYAFNTRPQKDLIVVRSGGQTFGVAKRNKSTVYWSPLPYNRASVFALLWYQLENFPMREVLNGLCKLKLITKEEKQEHEKDLRQERERQHARRLKEDLCEFIENAILMADITYSMEHLAELVTSSNEDERKLGAALHRFKQILNGTPSWEKGSGKQKSPSAMEAETFMEN